MIEDPYKILGVSPNASDEEIKRAYRRLAKQYHPDRNPGDQEAARKMQEVNAAYEQIKNPDRGRAGYGGYSRSYDTGDRYMAAAYNYIRFGRYQEALNILNSVTDRSARWYYLSAVAHSNLGNQVTALEHIRRAVSMDPDNPTYLQALRDIESGGSSYRQQAGHFRGFEMRSCSPWELCLFLWCCCPSC